MANRNSQRRRYRKVIIRGDADVLGLVTADLWPGDEVWDDRYQLLGTVDATGQFHASPAQVWN